MKNIKWERNIYLLFLFLILILRILQVIGFKKKKNLILTLIILLYQY